MFEFSEMVLDDITAATEPMTLEAGLPASSGGMVPGSDPVQMFYVLIDGGVWGPISSAAVAEVADAVFALTGSTVTITEA
jgi:hypothetical protein